MEHSHFRAVDSPPVEVISDECVRKSFLEIKEMPYSQSARLRLCRVHVVVGVAWIGSRGVGLG